MGPFPKEEIENHTRATKDGVKHNPGIKPLN